MATSKMTKNQMRRAKKKEQKKANTEVSLVEHISNWIAQNRES